MRKLWIVWNVDTARPVGDPVRSFRKALASAFALEARDDEHHTVRAA